MSRAPCTGSVAIDNATGCHAKDVNGVYEPTLELCGGLPVYQKKGNGDMWLEYHESNWRIRQINYRGMAYGENAYISAERACLPQDCYAGAWFVEMINNVFESAPLVTVTLLSAPSSDMEAIVERAQQAYDAEVQYKY